MKPEISIIVPVYKTEKTLRKCLDSIIGQTFGNWKLIAVDDRSPDGSAKILAEYEKTDDRIRAVTHSVNRGVSQARFTGLAHASGKYVVFVDSDDWMPRRALRVLYDKIEAEDADIVIGSAVKVAGRLGIVRTRSRNTYTSTNRTESITAPELFDKYFINYLGVNLYSPCMWGRIYRRSAIDRAGLEPVPFPGGEDLVFNMMLHPFLKKIGFVTDTVYFYRHGGVTSTSTPFMLDMAKKQYRLKRELIDRYDYRKAIPYLKVDFVHCFYGHFRNRVMLDGMSYGELEKLIEEEMKDDFYNGDLLEGIEPSDKVSAMRSGDIAAMIRIIRKDIKRIEPRHRVVNAISKLI